MIYEEDLAKIVKFIGKRIKLLRIAKNISSKKLAKLLKIAGEQLLSYESGTYRISANELANIAKLLKGDINYFFS